MDEAGLLPCEGDASSPEFAVPIKQMNKAFEPGKPFEFSCEVALLAKEVEVEAAASEGEVAAEVAGGEAATPAEADAETTDAAGTEAATVVTPVAKSAEEAA